MVSLQVTTFTATDTSSPRNGIIYCFAGAPPMKSAVADNDNDGTPLYETATHTLHPPLIYPPQQIDATPEWNRANP